MSEARVQPRLEIVPLKRAEAESFVRQFHRHHPPPAGAQGVAARHHNEEASDATS